MVNHGSEVKYLAWSNNIRAIPESMFPISNISGISPSIPISQALASTYPAVEVGIEERYAKVDVEEDPLQIRLFLSLLHVLLQVQLEAAPAPARRRTVDGVDLLLQQPLGVVVPWFLRGDEEDR